MEDVKKTGLDVSDCVIVLNMKNWQFTDKDSGEVKTGVKISYIDPATTNADEYNGYGYSTFESSVSEVNLESVPCYARPSFKSYMQKGQRCLKLDSLEFVQGASLWNHNIQ